MTCEVEDPTGHLSALIPLVFELCKLNKDRALDTGQFVVLPLDLRPADTTAEALV